MNNIEQIENIYRLYYNLPVIKESYSPYMLTKGIWAVSVKNIKENEQSNSN